MSPVTTAATSSCTRPPCPPASTSLAPGQRVDFGVAESRKGSQALQLKLLEAPASVAELRRRPAEELHGLIEDMIKVLEAKIMPDLRRDRFPDKKAAKTSPSSCTRSPANSRSEPQPSSQPAGPAARGPVGGGPAEQRR